MPLNITAIINEIQSRITAADSSTNPADLIRLIQAAQNYNTPSIATRGDLLVADSSNAGSIFYIRDTWLDDYGSFYIGRDSGTWSRLKLSADSAEDSDYRNITGVQGPSGPAALFYQGSTYGYSANGNTPTTVSTIDKYSLVSDGNATSVGNTTQARWSSCGQSSSTHGYTTQGSTGPWPSPNSNVIDKYPFAAGGNATDVGDLTQARYEMAGQTGPEYGYASGGFTPTGRIEKFPFASDANATDIGSIAGYYGSPAGFSSTTHGYQSGGYPDTAITDKFPFAVNANSTSVGNLVYALRALGGGTSSDTSGYVSGGYQSSGQNFNYIQKFSLSVDGNATDVANITVARRGLSAASGVTYGYNAGGYDTNNVNIIDKFPYAADVDATDVGDLTVARSSLSGNQY